MRAIATLVIAVMFVIMASVSFAAGKVHPVVVLQSETGGVLIGGTLNGKWLPASQMAAKLRGGEQYHLYSEMKSAGTTTGAKPGKSDLSEPWVKFASAGAEIRVAVAGDWNALPRIFRSENPEQKAYLAAVHEVLVSKGLGTSPASIKSLLRVDLEGDGHDEVIIGAQSPKYDGLSYRKGQYSFVMIRRSVGTKMKTTVVCGEFHTQDRHKGYLGSFETAGLWDIDGDGSLELSVAFACQSADGSRTTFYDVAHGRNRVLGQASHAN